MTNSSTRGPRSTICHPPQSPSLQEPRECGFSAACQKACIPPLSFGISYGDSRSGDRFSSKPFRKVKLYCAFHVRPINPQIPFPSGTHYFVHVHMPGSWFLLTTIHPLNDDIQNQDQHRLKNREGTKNRCVSDTRSGERLNKIGKWNGMSPRKVAHFTPWRKQIFISC